MKIIRQMYENCYRVSIWVKDKSSKEIDFNWFSFASESGARECYNNLKERFSSDSTQTIIQLHIVYLGEVLENVTE